MKTEIVEIRTEHYKKATKYANPFSCPLAMAVREHFKTDDCSCSLGMVDVGTDEYRVTCDWTFMPEGEGEVAKQLGKYVGHNIDELIALAKMGEEIPTVKLELTLLPNPEYLIIYK